jgi:hypothetical protein
VHSPLNGNPAAAIAVRPKQDTNLRIIKMSDVTNLTELNEFFGSTASRVVKVTGVPSLMPGETVEQAIARRAQKHIDIENKLAAKRAAKG